MRFTLLLVAALGADIKQKVNPVEKVTSLLEKLRAEIEEEGKSEAAAYDKFACFCKEQADNKQYAIEKFIEQENALKAQIEEKEAKKAQLDSEIVTLKEEIGVLEEEQQKADEIRAEEQSAYSDRAASLAKAISAMERAIAALQASKTQMKDAKLGYTLLSKYAATIKHSVALANTMGLTHDAGKLLALLDQPGKPAAYTYQSNEVISTLQSLLKNFKQKATQVDNEERETRQTHEMSSGARANTIKAKEKAKTEKATMSAQLEADLNVHQTDLQQTENSHAADQNFLDDLTVKCEDKAKAWDQRSNTRTAELTAISEALELLKGDVSKMYGSNDLGLLTVRKTAAAKRVAPLVEKKVTAAIQEVDEQSGDADDFEQDLNDEPVSFLQLPRPRDTAARKETIGFLAKKAALLKSTTLSTLLMKIKDAPTPFAKVKQMIQDLVKRLEEEASAEADQKAWCDENMKETTTERDEAQREVESLRALITEKNALVSQLTEQIGDLAQEIADLQKALNEETELREDESAKNTKTIEEAKIGLEAVEGAIKVLNAFYNPSLLQQNPAPAAEGYERFSAEGAGSDGKTVDDMAPSGEGDFGTEEYGGKSDSSKSIIALLEQIKEDFSENVDDTGKAEDDAQAAYDTFKDESETSIKDKGTLKETKEKEKTEAELDITTAEDDLKKQKELLKAALEELEKLKPVCVETGASWEERTARREQEIEALKEALKILQETDFGF
jgi:hypothetical protein